MNSYVNYRYQDFQNQSFRDEFRVDSGNYADFTGSRLKSCDFRGASLVGADFSETAIGRDEKTFQSAIGQLTLHIVLGIPLGIASWFLSQFTLAGCGVSEANPYAWLTNPFIWIAAFATAATMSKRKALMFFLGLTFLMALASALHSGVLAGISGILMAIGALGMSLFGIYLGYSKGSIAVGMIWMTVGVSSAISAGYSWLAYREIHYAILFVVLTIIPAILATKAFNLHFAKVKRSAMTSFCGADLTRARFVNAVLQNCDFRMARLEDVDWSGATFSNCKFPKGWVQNQQEVIAQDIDANQAIEKLATKKSQ
jgi:uncharacterized protein YjbI with pentapeptide repeats